MTFNKTEVVRKASLPLFYSAIMTILILAGISYAHVSPAEASASSRGYEVSLMMIPKNIITGEQVKFDVHVEKGGVSSKDLDIEMAVHDQNENEVASISMKEETPGHYDADYTFEISGHYAIHISFDTSDGMIQTEYMKVVENSSPSLSFWAFNIISIFGVAVALIYEKNIIWRAKKNVADQQN